MDENKFELRRYLYYTIIGITSLIACVFLPMLGSDVNLAFNIPNTTAGWVVYIVTKLIIATINILLFYCFMEQAKLNIQNDEHYKEANDILHRAKKKIAIPKSPELWNRQQYSKKGITIFITSILSAFALTNAILSFNLAEMLTYVFTITMGLIFGILQMKNAEAYWTIEYYEYALMIYEQIKANMEVVEIESNKQRDTDLYINSRDNILDASLDTSNISNSDKSMVVDSSQCSDNILGRSIYTSSTTSNRIYICPEETRVENKEQEEC